MNVPERKQAACSVCGKPVEHRYRPFCSKRCADLDLHRWLSGSYTIPGDIDPEELPPSDDEDRRG